jgi:hypothetical protein
MQPTRPPQQQSISTFASCGNMPTICSLLWRAYDDSIDMIEAMIEEEKIACSFRRTASSSLLPSPRM